MEINNFIIGLKNHKILEKNTTFYYP